MWDKSIVFVKSPITFFSTSNTSRGIIYRKIIFIILYNDHNVLNEIQIIFLFHKFLIIVHSFYIKVMIWNFISKSNINVTLMTHIRHWRLQISIVWLLRKIGQFSDETISLLCFRLVPAMHSLISLDTSIHR